MDHMETSARQSSMEWPGWPGSSCCAHSVCPFSAPHKTSVSKSQPSPRPPQTESQLWLFGISMAYFPVREKVGVL